MLANVCRMNRQVLPVPGKTQSSLLAVKDAWMVHQSALDASTKSKSPLTLTKTKQRVSPTGAGGTSEHPQGGRAGRHRVHSGAQSAAHVTEDQPDVCWLISQSFPCRFSAWWPGLPGEPVSLLAGSLFRDSEER